jgi:hypothetical protein
MKRYNNDDDDNNVYLNKLQQDVLRNVFVNVFRMQKKTFLAMGLTNC